MLNLTIQKTHYNYVDLLQKLSLPIHLSFYKTNELIKKFPSYYTVNFHFRVYKSPPLNSNRESVESNPHILFIYDTL